VLCQLVGGRGSAHQERHEGDLVEVPSARTIGRFGEGGKYPFTRGTLEDVSQDRVARVIGGKRKGEGVVTSTFNCFVNSPLDIQGGVHDDVWLTF
jgi:hypothetical protein